MERQLAKHFIPFSAVSAVKEATRAVHQQMESCHAMRRLMADDVTLLEYQSILMQWQLWTDKNMVHIASQLKSLAIFDLVDRLERFNIIQKDIARIVEMEEYILANQNALQMLPLGAVTSIDLASPEQALGAFYVLEGSTLGGAMITRHLKHHFGDQIPCQFYNGYGMGTPSKWHNFLKHFEQCIATEVDLDDACIGANAVFSSLLQTFQGHKQSAMGLVQ
ncbi:biliverdin-producing heme oxygenase [Alteromonas sp. LMIT006]|jgi:heme oxygenase|uniref:biliverdin-producing heme oxygenase n=1 Tax=Alteromonadaceae TaxID=72275 RepID=UPI0020CA8FD8|nr:biliverdin-producing heme oxygenase [Alteromonas sp. LMIT006]UTP73205.1 biliverdin-producing heme oxygenase [Alteromonas sp. LMIT006]